MCVYILYTLCIYICVYIYRERSYLNLKLVYVVFSLINAPHNLRQVIFGPSFWYSLGRLSRCGLIGETVSVKLSLRV